MLSPRVGLLDGVEVPRHRRDVVAATASVRWRGGSRRIAPLRRSVRRHRYDTIADGIGLDRVTANFREARVDDAIRVADQDALVMAHYLLRFEGLFLGSSCVAVPSAVAAPSIVIRAMCIRRRSARVR